MAQRGFTLLALLVAMAMLALASHGVMFVVSQQAQREREARMLRIGAEFVRAIGSYYRESPGSNKIYPPTLNDLIEDRRFVGIKRHMRELYGDPVNANLEWQEIREAGNGIKGVRSKSEGTPIRSGALDLGDLLLPAAARYSDWQFVFEPPPATGSAR